MRGIVRLTTSDVQINFYDIQEDIFDLVRKISTLESNPSDISNFIYYLGKLSFLAYRDENNSFYQIDNELIILLDKVSQKQSSKSAISYALNGLNIEDVSKVMERLCKEYKENSRVKFLSKNKNSSRLFSDKKDDQVSLELLNARLKECPTDLDARIKRAEIYINKSD